MVGHGGYKIMPIQENYKKFIQDDYEGTEEWKKVEVIFEKLLKFLSDDQVIKEIQKVHIPRGKSQDIEKIIVRYAEKIGFISNKKNLFKDYAVSNLRPDYFMPIGKTGILIEVERGQTSQNNNALKDLWKAHICKEADYLFIFVPMVLKQDIKNPDKVGGKPFNETVNRLSTFFDKDNYTNVRGLIIYGY